MNIDYESGDDNENVDRDMIITLKQLLMFAVQISYGLVSLLHIKHYLLSIFAYEINECVLGISQPERIRSSRCSCSKCPRSR